MNNIINRICQELEENIDEKTQRTSQKFFKEKIKIYGVKTDIVNKIGKKYFKSIKDKTKNEIYDLCDELWQSGCIEESFIACNWSYFVHKDYEPNDFEIFEKWVDSYVNNNEWKIINAVCYLDASRPNDAADERHYIRSGASAEASTLPVLSLSCTLL